MTNDSPMNNLPLQTEEKLRRLMEMQEHPERYTDEEIRLLMADKECQQLYEQMVKAADAVYAGMDLADVTPRHHGTLNILRKVAAVLVGVLLLSGITYAAIRYVRNVSTTKPVQTENAIVTPKHEPATVQMVEQDSTKTERVVFEDKELVTMLGEMAVYYGCEVSYKSDAVKHVRLYFTWDKAMEVDDVIAMFNKFERIHITKEGKKLTVE